MKFTEYDVSSIAFKAPSNTSFGGKSVPLDRPLVLQTPLVYVDHSTVNTYDGRPTTKLYLDVKDIRFAQFLMSLRGKLLESGKQNVESWWRPGFDEYTVANTFKSFLSESAVIQGSSLSLEVKVQPTCLVAEQEGTDDSTRKMADLSDFPTGSSCFAVISAKAVWFTKQSWGLTWSCSEVLVISKPTVEVAVEEEVIEHAGFMIKR